MKKFASRISIALVVCALAASMAFAKVKSSMVTPPLPQFPKLKKANGSLTGIFDEQVEILQSKFFQSPQKQTYQT